MRIEVRAVGWKYQAYQSAKGLRRRGAPDQGPQVSAISLAYLALHSSHACCGHCTVAAFLWRSSRTGLMISGVCMNRYTAWVTTTVPVPKAYQAAACILCLFAVNYYSSTYPKTFFSTRAAVVLSIGTTGLQSVAQGPLGSPRLAAAISSRRAHRSCSQMEDTVAACSTLAKTGVCCTLLDMASPQ